MAKAAKTVDVEITERMANKFLRDILERYENIETARGKYLNATRREREAMTVIYENMAHKGVSQKSAKTNVKIARALEKIKGWLSDLEAEDRKMAQRLAKAQGDKKQLLLFGELPPMPKPTRAEREEAALQEKEEREAEKAAKADLEAQQPAGAA
jgi:hypothetical protein